MKLVRGLTVRGRSFAFGGIAAAVCSFWLGQPDLLRVAVLLIVLPIGCAIAVLRTQHSIVCTRLIDPGRVPAGDEAKVTLRLENTSLVPSGLLLAEDTLPRGMSARPRFVVDRLDPRGQRDVFYRVRSEVRGRYRIGPLTMRVADPFGMCEIPRAFPGTDDLIVIPVVENLPVVQLGGEWTGSNDTQPSSIPAAGEDDVAVREYRYGDSLHRVHWKATARKGELMVRREEQHRQSRATILLDVRAGAHHGEGLRSSLEWCVSAAASLAIHLNRREYTLRVITETGTGLAGMGTEISAPLPDVEGLLLDALAVLTPSKIPTLRDASLALGRSGSDSLLIAILGQLTEQDAADLARRRGGTTTAIALLLRTPTWREGQPAGAPDPDFDRNVALLRNGGWRVLPVVSGDTLAAVWPNAGRAGVSAPGRDQGSPATVVGQAQGGGS
ncbi:MAG: DUF58 domain-containing protein [Sporichthyaceae bacterium]